MSPKEQPTSRDQEPTLFAAELSDAVPSVDLHGSRVHEAIAEVERLIHGAFMNGDEAVKIIHGRGTGKLKTAVEQCLRENKEIVAAFRGSSRPHEQGAVIVVALHKK